ncbi:hypothetical protein GQ457_08G034310 [Hibiscus cannabinus]
MENKINVVSTLSTIMLLFLSAVEVQSGALDVVAKFGAKADEKTDLSKVSEIETHINTLIPLSDAWKEACASATISSIVIPKGVYFLSQATLEGPCKAPIELQVQGTIKAPTDPKAFKEPKWIEFNKVENFKMSGGGVFDGQGTRAYKREGCDKKDFCSALPIDITVKNEESNVKLSNISFKNIRGTAALPEVVKIICSGKFPCENVELADIDIKYSGPKGPGVSECKNVKPKITGKQNPPACAAPVPPNPTPTV